MDADLVAFDSSLERVKNVSLDVLTLALPRRMARCFGISTEPRSVNMNAITLTMHTKLKLSAGIMSVARSEQPL